MTDANGRGVGPPDVLRTQSGAAWYHVGVGQEKAKKLIGFSDNENENGHSSVMDEL